tara:strand:- start:2835 stop:3215 length:381 start_codon:yes stop_codon:yes gene_type:complete
MDFKTLNKNNFIMYAMKMYTNPQCSDMEEFHEDLNRIKYIKRLLGRYESKGHLRERLILNHIIILNNVFGSEACCRILFFKIEDKFHSHLKTLLEYLQYLPKQMEDINLKKIPTHHKLELILKGIE